MSQFDPESCALGRREREERAPELAPDLHHQDSEAA
jgi:hypothetical protein